MITVIQYQHEKITILKKEIELFNKVIVKQKIQLANKQAINDILRDMLKVEKRRIKELESQLEWEKKLNKSMMDCIMADGK